MLTSRSSLVVASLASFRLLIGFVQRAEGLVYISLGGVTFLESIAR